MSQGAKVLSVKAKWGRACTRKGWEAGDDFEIASCARGRYVSSRDTATLAADGYTHIEGYSDAGRMVFIITL